MRKKKTRNSESEDFKKKAVLLTEQEGVSVGEIADQLGISSKFLSQCRSKLLKDNELENAERKLDALEENRRLKQELIKGSKTIQSKADEKIARRSCS
jgi:transposase-like protein